MESGLNMGEILGPIVLAVVINVSFSFPPSHIELTPCKSPYCMEPALCSGTTTIQRVTTTRSSPGQFGPTMSA